jgi:transposase, IS30 family
MKKKNYGHLTQAERDRIEAMLSSDHTQKEIASVLKRDTGTISREISRNRRSKHKKKKVLKGSYESSVAQQKAYVRRKNAKYQGKKINEDDALRKYIIKRLKKSWNPDEIAGRMKEEKKKFYASKTTIYEWLYSVWGQRYCKYLYEQRYHRKKRPLKKAKRTLIPNRIGIEMRPVEITRRQEFGHYEGDTIVSGKKTASKKSLAVLQERKAKYVKLKKIKSLRPACFNQAIENMQQDIAKPKSVTLDNGIENTKYEQLNIQTYFCDPYSSWQKGGVENCNKLIRRFFPKGCDLNAYSDKYVMMVEKRLNDKPRRSLNYRKPIEIMRENNLLNKKTEVALRG